MPFPLSCLRRSRKNRSLFFIAWLYFYLILAVGGFFEVTYTLPQSPADFRKFSRSENYQNYNQYDNHFRHTKTKHCAPSDANVYCQQHYLTASQKNQELSI